MLAKTRVLVFMAPKRKRDCIVLKNCDTKPLCGQFFQTALLQLGMQVRIRTNSLEFEFAPNSHEFVDHSELEFATSNWNPP